MSLEGVVVLKPCSPSPGNPDPGPRGRGALEQRRLRSPKSPSQPEGRRLHLQSRKPAEESFTAKKRLTTRAPRASAGHFLHAGHTEGQMPSQHLSRPSHDGNRLRQGPCASGQLACPINHTDQASAPTDRTLHTEDQCSRLNLGAQSPLLALPSPTVAPAHP